MRVLTTIVVLCAADYVWSLTKEEEIADNTVEVQFYEMSKSKWRNREQKFSSLVVEEVNVVCSVQYGSCGLANWTVAFEFNKTALTFNDDTPKSDTSYLSVFYYLPFEDSVPSNFRSKTKYMLNRKALEDITKGIRKDLNDEMDYSIVLIGEEEFSPEPHHLMDTIMIPVVVGLLLIVIITGVACWAYRKRKDKQAWYERLRAARKEASPKRSKVHPSGVNEEKPVWTTSSSVSPGYTEPARGLSYGRSPSNSARNNVSDNDVNTQSAPSEPAHNHSPSPQQQQPHYSPGRKSRPPTQIDSATVSVENNETYGSGVRYSDSHIDKDTLEIPDHTRRGHVQNDVTVSDEEEKSKRRKHKKHKKKRSHRHHRDGNEEEEEGEVGVDNMGYNNDDVSGLVDRASNGTHGGSGHGNKNRTLVKTFHGGASPDDSSVSNMAASSLGERKSTHVDKERPRQGAEPTNTFHAPRSGEESEEEVAVIPLQDSASDSEGMPAANITTQTTEL